jgi:hypothetical protein
MDFKQWPTSGVDGGKHRNEPMLEPSSTRNRHAHGSWSNAAMMTVLEKGPKHQANHKPEVCKGKRCASDENGALGCSVDADCPHESGARQSAEHCVHVAASTICVSFRVNTQESASSCAEI